MAVAVRVLTVHMPSDIAECALRPRVPCSLGDSRATIATAEVVEGQMAVTLVGTLPDILRWTIGHHWDDMAAWNAVNEAIARSMGE